MSEERDEIIRKLNAAREELRRTGPIHRRDLQKHIRRLRGAANRMQQK